jgi:hypothetical protein
VEKEMGVNSRFYFNSVKKFLIDENIIIVSFRLIFKILDCYNVINKKSKLVNKTLLQQQNKLDATKYIMEVHSNDSSKSLNIFQ